MAKTYLSGRHATMIPMVERIERIWQYARNLPGVVKCGPGVIVSAGGGAPRVKVLDESGAILLVVRGSRSVQEFRVFSKTYNETKLALSKFVRNNGWHLTFT